MCINNNFHIYPTYSERLRYANSVNPNQIAPSGAIWSGLTLFAMKLLPVLTFLGSIVDLLEFYIEHYEELRGLNIVGKYDSSSVSSL